MILYKMRIFLMISMIRTICFTKTHTSNDNKMTWEYNETKRDQSFPTSFCYHLATNISPSSLHFWVDDFSELLNMGGTSTPLVNSPSPVRPLKRSSSGPGRWTLATSGKHYVRDTWYFLPKFFFVKKNGMTIKVGGEKKMVKAPVMKLRWFGKMFLFEGFSLDC